MLLPPLIEDTLFYAELERHGLRKTRVKTKNFTYWQTKDGKLSVSVQNFFGFVPSAILIELLAQVDIEYQEAENVD